jgi:hypothetical protein
MQDFYYCILSVKLSYSDWINISSLVIILSIAHIAILFVQLHLMQTDIVATEFLNHL